MRPEQERVERLRRRWDEIERRREPPGPCSHSSGQALFAVINPNGSKFVYEGCSECRARLRPGEWVDQLRRPEAANAPVVEDLRVRNPPCQVCGGWGTELHHWAPRQFFGVEAEHWPTAWLCPVCHQRWHAVMRGARQGSFDLSSGADERQSGTA
jgi:hypothetical protein